MFPPLSPSKATRGVVTERRASAAVWIATCAGVGYFPVAPGTAGAAVGLGLVVAAGRLPLGRPWMTTALAAAALVIFAAGVWATGKAEKFFGRTDPAPAVLDEVCGQMITFLRQPDVSWEWLLAGFVLFRIFDVIKPFPARRAEKIIGGWGIMLDDAVAGAYSLATLWLLGSALK